MSKQKFKALVKSSCERACFLYLLNENQKLSKGKELNYTKLETQSYLNPGSGISVDSMRKIYHIRCREVFVKCNFPSAFSDKKCLAPHVEIDEQSHVYSCSFFTYPNEIISASISYEDIFGRNVEKQIEVMNIFYSRLEVRKSYLLPQQSGVRAPADPSRVPGLRQAQPLGIKEAKLKKKLNKNKTSDLAK